MDWWSLAGCVGAASAKSLLVARNPVEVPDVLRHYRESARQRRGGDRQVDIPHAGSAALLDRDPQVHPQGAGEAHHRGEGRIAVL